jgi:hypothetical protein
MLEIILAGLGGAVLMLVLLYALGKRHQHRTGRVTGPNSRVPVSENVIPIVRKG